MDAEAKGSSSKAANNSDGWPPSSSARSLCTSSVSAAGTRSSKPRNSRDSDSPNAPGLDAMICPNFTYVGPSSAKVCGSCLITFCCHGPLPGSLGTTRAAVRLTCQPVTATRAASTGKGTRSSLATSRCLVELIPAVCQTGGVKSQFSPGTPGLHPALDLPVLQPGDQLVHGGAVDGFPDDVGVPGMPGQLVDHMQDHPAHRPGLLVFWEPRDLPRNRHRGIEIRGFHQPQRFLVLDFECSQ